MASDVHVIGEASSLRKNELQLGAHQPLPEIRGVLTKLEYKYQEDRFGDDFSGCSVLLNEGTGLIGFNLNHLHNEGFRRFTICHEIGHLSLESHRRALYRNSGAKHMSRSEYRPTDSYEREADLFAAHFLAPTQAVASFTKAYDFDINGVERTKDHFGLSFDAAARRFLEETDMVCVLLVVDGNGQILYDQWSGAFRRNYWPDQIRGRQVSDRTPTFDLLSSEATSDTDTVSVLEWYPNLDPEIEVVESVVRAAYGDSIIVLLSCYDPSI